MYFSFWWNPYRNRYPNPNRYPDLNPNTVHNEHKDTTLYTNKATIINQKIVM